MKKNLSIPPKAEEDASDALSTSTNNSGHHSATANSPSRLQNFNSEDLDTLCDGSKKIRKKRNAYQKIDDDIRLRLLEAVKHGETLKSAAKKFKINYSSAKSILHTYRKEGRILKKSAQERNIKRNGAGGEDGGDLDGTPQPQSDNEDGEDNKEFQKPAKASSMQVEGEDSQLERVKSEKINNGQELVDNLVNILKMNRNGSKGVETGKTAPQTPKVLIKPTPKTSNFEEEQEGPVVSENTVYNDLLSGKMANPANLMNLTSILQGSSIEKFKMLDNMFANMSASPFPVMSKALKTYTESSGSKSEGIDKDLQANEELGTPQNPVKKSDEIARPHPLRFNTAQLLQEKIETQLNNAEDPDWDVTIENAAIDTFKSFMDAQLLLCDALKKASYLNSLMQAQKARTESNSGKEEV